VTFSLRGPQGPDAGRATLFLVVTCVSLLLGGCGYALAGRGSFLPSEIRVVGIPQLQNQSTFFNVEQVLSEKIRTEFIGRGKFRVLPQAMGADAVLTGTVTSISVQPVGFTDQQLASRYLFVMTMKVEFTETSTSRVLWSNDALVFRETYELSIRGTNTVEGATFLDQERSSFDRIASDVARSVVTAIVEAF
jgi:hypothetical protein